MNSRLFFFLFLIVGGLSTMEQVQSAQNAQKPSRFSSFKKFFDPFTQYLSTHRKTRIALKTAVFVPFLTVGLATIIGFITTTQKRTSLNGLNQNSVETALNSGNMEPVREALENGADPNSLRGFNRDSPLEYALYYFYDEGRHNDLRAQNVLIFSRLLYEYGAQTPENLNNSLTELMSPQLMVASGCGDLIDLYIQHGYWPGMVTFKKFILAMIDFSKMFSQTTCDKICIKIFNSFFWANPNIIVLLDQTYNKDQQTKEKIQTILNLFTQEMQTAIKNAKEFYYKIVNFDDQENQKLEVVQTLLKNCVNPILWIEWIQRCANITPTENIQPPKTPQFSCMIDVLYDSFSDCKSLNDQINALQSTFAHRHLYHFFMFLCTQYPNHEVEKQQKLSAIFRAIHGNELIKIISDLTAEIGKIAITNPSQMSDSHVEIDKKLLDQSFERISELIGYQPNIEITDRTGRNIFHILSLEVPNQFYEQFIEIVRTNLKSPTHDIEYYEQLKKALNAPIENNRFLHENSKPIELTKNSGHDDTIVQQLNELLNTTDNIISEKVRTQQNQIDTMISSSKPLSLTFKNQ